MRDCPDCGRPVDGSECGYCGYGAPKTPPRGAKVLAASHKPAVLPPMMTKEEWDRNREACMPHLREALAKLKRRQNDPA